ncbi:hypothetical protein [Marivirga arenosa]|uniref:Uncharacterized protein n=1 Tax=Marivirga arenosa TaxID=3059076 RepID=A0AA49JI73_9BACT|nr:MULTISPECIES: hypothetical protein [unclassified Marivirga]WKK86787.1 hypothetical protein QYS48_07815 [Marivirga sp. ABR2-2]WNB18097.1 hypothetical protein QYS47_29200 [Marivirga sp. BKB1-2]
MKILKSLILLVLILNGCSFGERELIFGTAINYFHKDFISHFPKTVPIEFSLNVISQNTTNSHPHVWLKYYKSENELDLLKDSIENVAVAKYQTSDSCLLVIDKHLNKSNWYKIDKSKRIPKKIDYNDKPCHHNKYPVPNFYSTDWSETNSNPTRLKGYDLYVLEAKPGIYMDSTKLPNGLYTPKDWKHGYSKGIAINDETSAIIFWADIW